ncbi:hypothetical protein LPJ66_000529 [Kickxella alabastrina]|uniref:Uncharacterized protein n=1 Tax=Kickxella alabastrina TaxID=61397 RepID=A0ACC1IVN8_9FUNG|nr:hypothetical protein LPJ66_000529 [Kickxella alabastrina]
MEHTNVAAAASTASATDAIREHIHSPLTAISRLFETHKGAAATDAGSESDDPHAFSKAVQEHFKGVFSSAKAVERIPVLDQTGDRPKPEFGTLVRFRCMVQDPSYGEELHMSVAHLVNASTGETKQIFSQYTDVDYVLEDGWEIDYSSANNLFTEKEVAYCVSVPGQSEWAQLGSTAFLDSALGSLAISSDESGDASAGPATKYPLKGQKHSAALVKFYAPSTAPKVSSLIDVVGIYELVYSSRDQHGEGADENAQWPCVHSIFHTGVSLDSLVPGLPTIVAGEFADRRNMCVSHLASVLGGDDLAAHYLVLHLLSKTVAVQDTKVGKFSLNLIGFPTTSKDAETSSVSGGFALSNLSTKRVGDALALLLPRCVEIPFELKLLNETPFLPNAESGDLHSGALQLAAGTQIVCDETCLHEGTLGERGVRNLHALQTTILDQTVTYVYPFQPIDMATNLRVLVLSSGKSILQNDCDVYLSEPTVQFLAGIGEDSVDDLKPLDPMHTEQLRQYLEHARQLEFGVPKDISDRISEEYADLRRKAHERSEKMMTQAELALVVTVAKLVSIGKGETELNWDSWKEACALEERRNERNARFLAKKAARASPSAEAADGAQ